MLRVLRPPSMRYLGPFAALCCCLVLALGSCGSDDPTQPEVAPVSDLGAMPPVPKPTSLTSEAKSDTVTVVKPLRVVFAPRIYNALSDWSIHTRACTEEFWVTSCGSWSAYEEFPASWVTDLPAKWKHVPSTNPLAKPQFLDIEGKAMDPGELKYYKGNLNNHRCGPLDIYICWNDAEWITDLPALATQPYLCRDRFWVVAGKSQILPQGFSQEITTSITEGVEKTECDEFSVSMTVEGEVSDGFNSLKTTIEASYTKTVTKSVFQQTSVETRYTPEPVPAGKQAVYQVWVLVDRYTITDKNGKPFSDPNYAFGACKRVHVQGVWEAHAITYFPDTAVATAQAGE